MATALLVVGAASAVGGLVLLINLFGVAEHTARFYAIFPIQRELYGTPERQRVLGGVIMLFGAALVALVGFRVL